MVKTQSFITLACLTILAFGFSQFVQAHGAQEGAIGPEELQNSIGALNILDVRSFSDYEEGHIETALVLPLKEISEARLVDLGFLPGEAVVVYADSDNVAKKAKTLLEVFGFASVKYLSGGLTHWKEDRFPIVSGEMQVDGTQVREMQEAASSLKLVPEKYEFGVISKEGGVVTTTFTVTNTSQQTVTIEEMSTSCGCTSAEISNKVIESGKSVELQVFFDPNFHKEPQGKFSRTVFLQTSEGNELQAKIYVEIKE